MNSSVGTNKVLYRFLSKIFFRQFQNVKFEDICDYKVICHLLLNSMTAV